MSVNEDPSTWRRRTYGGIPYKLIEGPSGSFADEDAEVTEVYLIVASDLVAFVLESFPPMTIWAEMFSFSVKRTLPSFPALITKRISFEAFPEGKPCDPWGHDAGASTKTYARILKVTINYGTGKNDAEDPETFLEVSAEANVDLLAIPGGRGKWWPANVAAKDVDVPITVTVPMTDWTVKLSQVDRTFFRETLCPRLKAYAGVVNQEVMPLFMDAGEETIMFTGYSVEEQYSWRSTTAPPLRLELRFVEKHVESEDADGNEIVVGHNHFYRPDTGLWEVLHGADGTRLYFEGDLNLIFEGWVPD